jgi:hypothetical protein
MQKAGKASPLFSSCQAAFPTRPRHHGEALVGTVCVLPALKVTMLSLVQGSDIPVASPTKYAFPKALSYEGKRLLFYMSQARD